MGYWEDNQTFLKEWDPWLLDELEVEGEACVLEESEAGQTTLRIEGHSFHHANGPENQGRGVDPLHLIFGFGLGQFLPNYSLPSGARLIVFEPNPAFVRVALRQRFWRSIFQEKNLTLCCSFKRFHYLTIKWRACVASYCFWVNPAHAKWFGHEFRLFQNLLSNLNRMMPSRTTNRLFPVIQQSTMDSLTEHVKAPGFEVWRGALKGKPAVIVAAGPSLDKNLAELAVYRDKVIIFALGRTVAALARHNISPHFLVHVEAQDYYHLIADCPNLSQTVFFVGGPDPYPVLPACL